MKSLKKSLSIVLAVLMLFSTLVVGTITSANASITGQIYFDNTTTGWSTVYCFLGHNNYLKSYSMTLDSDGIWKTNKSFTNEWNDATGVFFAPADGGVSSGRTDKNISNRNSLGLTEYTATNTTVAAGSDHCYVPASAEKNTSTTIMTVDEAKALHGSVEPSSSTQATTASTEATQPTTQPTSEPVEKTKVYFVNSGEWTTVKAYAWSGGVNNGWPGADMTKTGEQAGNGADIYSIEFDSEYQEIIFNNGGDSSKTGNLTLQKGKYFDFKSYQWYDDPAEIAATGDVVTLVGDMNGWSQNSTKFVDGSVTVELNANETYKFKIMINGGWHGNDGTMTADNCTGWTFASDKGDCKITTTIAGTYTFNFDTETKKLSVVYPEPAKTNYTVVFKYETVDGTQTLTKTTTLAESDITKVATSVMPNIENKMYSYALGECTAEGTTITANLVATKKFYKVTVDNNLVGEYEYKKEATVTLKDGTKYTFYVTDDVEIDSDTVTMDAVTLSLDALTVTDEIVSMDLLATAKIENFARMGVAFATSDKSKSDIEDAVLNVATDTAVSNKIAVHNSTVDSPNVSGYYQFVYTPFVSRDKATTTLYFYTFVVDTDGRVEVSSGVPVDLANAVA